MRGRGGFRATTFRCWRCLRCREIAGRDGDERGTDAGRCPAEEALGDGAAEAALAGAHAAAGLQFGVAPFAIGLAFGAGDGFAAADECGGFGEVVEGRVEGEGLGEIADEGAIVGLAGAFGERFIEAADAGGFAGAVDAGDGGLAAVVDDDETVIETAAEELGDFGVGDEAEAGGEAVYVNRATVV